MADSSPLPSHSTPKVQQPVIAPSTIPSTPSSRIKVYDNSANSSAAAFIMRGPDYIGWSVYNKAQMSDTAIDQLLARLRQRGVSYVCVGSGADDTTLPGYRADKAALMQSMGDIDDLGKLYALAAAGIDDPLVSALKAGWERVKSFDAKHVVSILCAAGTSRQPVVSGSGSGSSSWGDHDQGSHYIQMASKGQPRFNWPAKQMYKLLAEHKGDLTVLVNSCNGNRDSEAARDALCTPSDGTRTRTVIIPCGTRRNDLDVEHARTVIQELASADVDWQDASALAGVLVRAHDGMTFGNGMDHCEKRYPIVHRHSVSVSGSASSSGADPVPE